MTVAHLRRSCLAVPASSPSMIAKAAASAADEVFIDLEDACAPSEKVPSRKLVVEALNSLDFDGKVRVVRINDVTTRFCYGDVIELVSGAGANLDSLLVPKIEDASHVHFVDHLLTGLEGDLGLERRIGLELLIETAAGAVHLKEIAEACPARAKALHFGPGDYAVDLGIPRFELGMIDPDYPGHQWHWVMSALAVQARASGVQAIDGPYVDFHDRDGYLESARRAKLLGFEGKWCIHPNQIEWANAEFTPSRELYDEAERVLAAYAEATAAGRGAALHEGKMIDEATRKLAERLVAAGRAAGLRGRDLLA
jgi:citrate lyase subunit beta/citryl-CoA lyase